MDDTLLDDLQKTLHREIPLCAHMGVEVERYANGRLTLRLPLAPNRNHKRTAFAGSLNALCTITGWSLVYLLARSRQMQGDIVIRRSSIKFLQPVDRDVITATTEEVDAALVEYFADYAPFLVVALLPEDAQALDDDYERVVMDEALA